MDPHVSLHAENTARAGQADYRSRSRADPPALSPPALRLDQPLPPAATWVCRLFGHGFHWVRRLRLMRLLRFGRCRFEFPFHLAGVGNPLLGLGGGRRSWPTLPLSVWRLPRRLMMRRLIRGHLSGCRCARFTLACRREVFAACLTIAGKSRQARRFDCHSADIVDPARARLHQRLLAFLDLGSRQNLDGIDRRAWFFETGFHAAFPPYASSAPSPAAPPAPPLGLVLRRFVAGLRRGRRRLRGGFFFATPTPPPATAAPAGRLAALLLRVRSFRGLVDFLLFFVRD